MLVKIDGITKITETLSKGYTSSDLITLIQTQRSCCILDLKTEFLLPLVFINPLDKAISKTYTWIYNNY